MALNNIPLFSPAAPGTINIRNLQDLRTFLLDYVVNTWMQYVNNYFQQEVLPVINSFQFSYGPDIVSADTIKPTALLQRVTGTTPVSTIVPPPTPPGTFAGPFIALATDGFSTIAQVPATSTTPAVGNIMQAVSVPAGFMYMFAYFPVSATWGVVASLDPTQFAPALNPPGGLNNYAPIDAPNFTTSISLGGVSLSSLFAAFTNPPGGANNYATIDSVPPIVNPPGGQNNYAPLNGRTNGSWPTAGQIGEVVQVGGSTNITLGAAGSANYIPVASAPLGAGDWDISGEIAISGALATTAPYIAFGAYMSTAGPNGPPTLPGAAMMAIQIDWQAVNIPMGMAVLNTASPVTVYLIANAWTLDPATVNQTIAASGFIHARRAS